MGLLSGMPTCGLTNGVITEKSDFLHGSGFQERAFQETGSGYARLEVLSITLPSTCHQRSPRTQSGFKERGLLVGELSRSFAHPFLPQGSQMHQPYSQAGTQGN